MSKIPLLVSIVFYGLYCALRYYTGNAWLPLLIFIIPISLLVINGILRKKLKFKNWFLKHLSFLLEQQRQSYISDIPKDLLFEKLIEVIDASHLKLVDQDNSSCEILCSTSLNFWTWGENIYISLIEKDHDETEIIITSTTIFGSSSWKRNKDNYQSFINTFETSLTI